MKWVPSACISIEFRIRNAVTSWWTSRLLLDFRSYRWFSVSRSRVVLSSESHTIHIEYIVQGHRYNLFEGVGCYPATYNTWLAYPLSVTWPMIIGVVSAIYCGAYHLIRTKGSFTEAFHSFDIDRVHEASRAVQ